MLPGLRVLAAREHRVAQHPAREGAGLALQAGQHVAPVDAPGVAVGRAGVQPLALEDLHAAQPGVQVGAVQPHLQALAGQPRGHAVQHALGAEHAELADPCVDLLEVGRAARRQRLQAGALGLPGPGAAGVEPAHGLGHELLVGRQVVELATAAQQQALVQAALQAALARLDGAVLVADAGVVARGAHAVVLAQGLVAHGQLLALGQVVERRRQAVGAVLLRARRRPSTARPAAPRPGSGSSRRPAPHAHGASRCGPARTGTAGAGRPARPG